VRRQCSIFCVPSCPAPWALSRMNDRDADVGLMKTRPSISTRPSTKRHFTPRAPTATTALSSHSIGSASIFCLRSSNSLNEGPDSAMASVPSSASWSDRASMTTLVAPDLNSTLKLNPSSLLAH
jgi:hypothetical protein